MIVIGEKINATRKSVAAALEARDEEFLRNVAVEQAKAGANYIDVNCGDPRPGMEARRIAWVVELVQSATDLPVAIDTADLQAMKAGISLAKKKPVLNSLSLESRRLEPLLPVAAENDCTVIALLMSDEGTPCGVDDRLTRAEALIGKITGVGRKLDEIIIDPCFLPVSTDTNAGRHVLDAIARIRRHWPDVHIGGGCSNISFGLPKRRYVNFALLSQAICCGMDVGIIDPCIPGIMATILAAEAVAGRDEFCMNYVTAERAGRLG